MSISGINAASGFTNASSTEAAIFIATGAASIDTAGSLKLPFTRSGARSVSGLKSFGTTTARRSSASLASDSEPSTESAESTVSSTNRRGRNTPASATRSARAH